MWRQGCTANISQCYPPQVSPGLSACLNLVPRMEGLKFLDLIHEVAQPLPILTLKGVQFGQTGLRFYSQHRCIGIGVLAALQRAHFAPR